MRYLSFLHLILVILSFCSQIAYGQIQSAEIGVNGLTCSQCTHTVEISIRKLDFVADVQMNLEKTSGIIIFNKEKMVDLEEVANAVVHAGFSVRYLNAQINFDSVAISNGYCHFIKGQYFQFVNLEAKTLNGQVLVKLNGRKYMPAKEYRKIKSDLKFKCGNGSQKEFFVSPL